LGKGKGKGREEGREGKGKKEGKGWEGDFASLLLGVDTPGPLLRFEITPTNFSQ